MTYTLDSVKDMLSNRKMSNIRGGSVIAFLLGYRVKNNDLINPEGTPILYVHDREQYLEYKVRYKDKEYKIKPIMVAAMQKYGIQETLDADFILHRDGNYYHIEPNNVVLANRASAREFINTAARIKQEEDFKNNRRYMRLVAARNDKIEIPRSKREIFRV